jgi:hypothetical protein
MKKNQKKEALSINKMRNFTRTKSVSRAKKSKLGTKLKKLILQISASLMKLSGNESIMNSLSRKTKQQYMNLSRDSPRNTKTSS